MRNDAIAYPPMLCVSWLVACAALAGDAGDEERGAPGPVPPADEVLARITSCLAARGERLVGKSVWLRLLGPQTRRCRIVAVEKKAITVNARGLSLEVTWDRLGQDGAYRLGMLIAEGEDAGFQTDLLWLGVHLGRAKEPGFQQVLGKLRAQDAAAAGRIGAALRSKATAKATAKAASARVVRPKPAPADHPKVRDLAPANIHDTPNRAAQGFPPPSSNAGRTGVYQCTTSNPTYNYFVCAPTTYSDRNPAGLYLFFHGQWGGGGGPHFGHAQTLFVDGSNIVAIKMQYTDGDNASDTAGKVDAAVEAVKQTMADYRIVAGRGIAASFSGGGLPHGLMLDKFQKGKASYRGLPWPFHHMQLTGSNFFKKATGAASMSWYIGVGGGEWDLARLGRTNTARAVELYEMIVRSGYCPDVHFKIIKEKGHSIAAADWEASAALFAVTDVLMAPFVYEPAYAERELAPAAAAANARSYRAVLSRLDRLVSSSVTKAAVREKAEALRSAVRARIAASVALVEDLVPKDPVRGVHYARQLAMQLAGLPERKEVRAALAAAAKDGTGMALLTNGLPAFADGLHGFITGGAKLNAEAVPVLEQIRSLAGEDALLGRMAREFLLLK